LGTERNVTDDYDPTVYGAAIADDYDEVYGALETDRAVAFLAGLAGAGPVLELGIGTGRLALPLAARGLRVHGVEASPAMAEKMRTKPGGDGIDVTIGNFASVVVDERFTLVVLAFNTIFALPDQDAQVDVFENAARHLHPGGRFVVEAWVPDVARFHRGQAVWPRHIGSAHVSFEVAALDPVRQLMQTTQVRAGPDGVRLYPANHRYAWPSELDLMARVAGMRLEHRYADWDRSPFTASTMTHVSVYELTGSAAVQPPGATIGDEPTEEGP
jgi:SAM-dependent methyltransferase